MSTPIIENDSSSWSFTVDFSLAALQKHLATLKPMGARPRRTAVAEGRGAGLGQCRRNRQASQRRTDPQHAGRDRRRPPLRGLQAPIGGNVRVYVPLRVGDARSASRWAW